MKGSRTAKVKIQRKVANRISTLSTEIIDLSWHFAVTGIVPGKPPKPKHELVMRIIDGAYKSLRAAEGLRKMA